MSSFVPVRPLYSPSWGNLIYHCYRWVAARNCLLETDSSTKERRGNDGRRRRSGLLQKNDTSTRGPHRNAFGIRIVCRLLLTGRQTKRMVERNLLGASEIDHPSGDALVLQDGGLPTRVRTVESSTIHQQQENQLNHRTAIVSFGSRSSCCHCVDGKSTLLECCMKR